MQTIDLSHAIRQEMPVFFGAPQPVITHTTEHLQLAGEDVYCTESTLFFNNHLGTHMDAPAHLLPGGAFLGQLPPERFWGQAYIIDVQAYRDRLIPKSYLEQYAAEIAVSHHERWDGTGYPKGLAGEAIPVVGRITALADVFDALMSVRPYKPAWPIEKAIAFVADGSGSHFDPACVEAFFAHFDEIAAIAGTGRDDEVISAA
mgnify:CR=1 FL=1